MFPTGLLLGMAEPPALFQPIPHEHPLPPIFAAELAPASLTLTEATDLPVISFPFHTWGFLEISLSSLNPLNLLSLS